MASGINRSIPIAQPSIFGRLGTGIGKGLAEQVPKEIERGRLASGLEELGANSNNLTPFQQFAKLSSIPGVTPQMLESGANLLRHQSTRNALTKNAKGSGIFGQEGSASPTENIPQQGNVRDVNFLNLDQRKNGQEKQVAKSPTEVPYGQPQIQENNPLRPQASPKAPWTPQKKMQILGELAEEFPNLEISQLNSMANDFEARELAQSENERAIDTYQKGIRKEVEDEFDEKVKSKLQKSDIEGVYKDITGENLERAKRRVGRELKLNPNASPSEVIDRETTDLLNFAKSKSDLRTLANRSADDKLTKQDETLKKLKSIQKQYARSGELREYFDTLRTDFNLSPGAAAYIAYPPSEKVDSYIKSSRITPGGNHKKIDSESRKKAIEIGSVIKANDSLLGIAKRFKDKDPFFNANAFFDQLDEDQDQLGLTPEQRAELGIRDSDLFPNWGDFWSLPFFRGQL